MCAVTMEARSFRRSSLHVRLDLLDRLVSHFGRAELELETRLSLDLQYELVRGHSEMKVR